MPEGDVVWRVSRQLDAALAGRTLTRSDFRVPRYATTNLAGRSVQQALARGKHLLIRVDGGVTIHTHLRMDGSWRIRPAGGYPPRDHRIRVVLENAEWQALGYLLGVVEVLPTAREGKALGHLGPDLLGPDWDTAEAVRRLQTEPDRPIGEALMDQRNLAGIGNLYKSEVLFLRGISPWQQRRRGWRARASRRACAAPARREQGTRSARSRRATQHAARRPGCTAGQAGLAGDAGRACWPTDTQDAAVPRRSG